MTQRITTLQNSKNFIETMFRQRSQLADVQKQINTGMKITTPSEDPGRSGIISQFRNAVDRMQNHIDRTQRSLTVLEQQEATVDSAEQLLLRLKEIATQSANSPNGPQARRAYAEEVFEIREALVGMANTRVFGKYIYGGADDDDPPFDQVTNTNPADPNLPEGVRFVWDGRLATGVTNAQDAEIVAQSQTRSVSVGDSENVRINTSGQIFEGAIAAAEVLGRALTGWSTNLDGNNLPDGTGTQMTFPGDEAVQSAAITVSIDMIETARKSDMVAERSSIGARMNRMEQALQSLESLKFQAEKLRSEMQDADIFEAASSLSTMQTAFEGMLAAGAQINNLSLLNFI